LPWTIHLVERYKKRWVWDILCEYQNFWNVEYLWKFKDNIHIGVLSGNNNIKWDDDLINNLDNFNWDFRELSKSKVFPWSIDLLKKYKEKCDWVQLSCNQYLIWDEELLNEFSGDLVWSLICEKSTIKWTISLINKHSEKLSSSENIWNTLKPYIDDEMVIELLEEIKNKSNG
jgi:hypothetical protein